ncbi:regulatory protein GemA [Zoogloea sp.]|uniref:gp16 family protein n=1 Tax=Zoogloea sp. TaxID=49181 RepID=UPI001AD48962|nr:regulatory protein GemA [Zoogloea sp.]MBN8283416.1 regulatory protein GemA [Zoogloea sp.]
MPSIATEHIRASKIRMIQVAKRQLAIEDADYRAAIGRAVKGKSSCSDCTTLQLDRVIDELKRLGFRPRKPANAKPKPERRPLDTSADASKARAVWLLLAELGALRDPSEAALNAYVCRQTGVDDLAWVRDMAPVTEGLKAWAARLLPAALQIRLDALKAAKLLVPGDTVADVIQRAAPTRRPDTFDALWSAWERLAIIASAQVGEK